MKPQLLFCGLLLSLLLLGGIKVTFSQTDFWQPTNGPYGYPVTAIAIDSSEYVFAATNGGGVFRSSDSGNHWMPINTGLTNTKVRTLAISRDYIFAGTDSGIFRYKYKDAIWTQVNSGLTNKNIKQLVIALNGYVFAGTYGGYYDGDKIFRSSDNGDSWVKITSPELFVISLAINPSGIVFASTNCCRLAGTRFGSIFKSLDNGIDWTRIYWHDLGVGIDTYMGTLAINSIGYIFASASGGILVRSTDGGVTWKKIQIGPSNIWLGSFAFDSRNYIFAKIDSNGVFRSKDHGESWTEYNAGLTNKIVLSLAINSHDYIFAGTDSSGVFRTLQPTTAVKTIAADVPTLFSLKQNYPNPFLSEVKFQHAGNPSTTIQFSLPHPGYVTLKVYNVLGEEVATLVAGNLPAGRHQVEWNAEKMAGGVYFYRLHAGALIQTKKLIVLE